jgi:hypothetical protein
MSQGGREAFFSDPSALAGVQNGTSGLETWWVGDQWSEPDANVAVVEMRSFFPPCSRPSEIALSRQDTRKDLLREALVLRPPSTPGKICDQR